VSAAAIDNDAVTTLANEALSAALGNLSYRERRVLGLRYGLGGKTPLTLGEVGRTLNVTSERVRQVERESIQKLQQLSESQQLRTDSESHPDSAPSSLRVCS
jgi:RNA polymerase primary sigma factor